MSLSIDMERQESKNTLLSIDVDRIIENKDGKPSDELDVKCLGENLGVNIKITTVNEKGENVSDDLSNNNSKETKTVCQFSIRFF